ncbi:deoxyribonuclease I [Litorivicinus lipolyticus]|uniref:Deoxyribonuclease I n=1 Tax=Litorivicinus lipolyticus TaxID=418701 RepID=A0A5Q2Q9B4_9GAMM|nr:endonuclease [Litorivicinus lipolyticus]QGG80818.1 deoxyribonuclease I [Litorivicinus lipolyticus]
MPLTPRLISALLALSSWLATADDSVPWYTAMKRDATIVHAFDTRTFYCGCRFFDRRINAAACGYEIRKQPERGRRMEWEHVMPAWQLGHQRACWRDGKRKGCERNDPEYLRMATDLHNLVPSVGELNGDRSNFPFGNIRGERRVYGACDFEVDFKARKAEPPAHRQGDIARIYFYMRDRYGLLLGRSQTYLLTQWAAQDPVDQWERVRNQRIARIQGNANCYVGGCIPGN